MSGDPREDEPGEVGSRRPQPPAVLPGGVAWDEIPTPAWATDFVHEAVLGVDRPPPRLGVAEIPDTGIWAEDGGEVVVGTHDRRRLTVTAGGHGFLLTLKQVRQFRFALSSAAHATEGGYIEHIGVPETGETVVVRGGLVGDGTVKVHVGLYGQSFSVLDADGAKCLDSELLLYALAAGGQFADLRSLAYLALSAARLHVGLNGVPEGGTA